MASDNFNRANANPCDGSWAHISLSGSIALASNAVVHASGGGSDAGMRHTSSAVAFAQVRVLTLNDGDGGPALYTTTGNNGYMLTRYDGANYYLYRIDGGSLSFMTSNTAAGASGDDWTLERSGNDVVAKRNGTEVARATDTTYTSVFGGVFIYGTIVLDDFTDGASSGSTYNDAVAESAAATDAVVSAAVFPRAVAESAAATDAVLSAAVFSRAIAESAAATDAVVSALVISVVISETASAADGPSGDLDAEGGDEMGGSLTRAGAIAESAAATDSSSSVLVAVGAVAESAAATDADAAALVAIGVIGESVAATDTDDGAQGGSTDTSETAAATDSVSAAAVFVAVVAESAAATDDTNGSLPASTYDEAVAESAAATDAVAVLKVLAETISESSAATDATVSVGVFVGAITEVSNATDSVNATGGSDVAPDAPRGGQKKRKQKLPFKKKKQNDPFADLSFNELLGNFDEAIHKIVEETPTKEVKKIILPVIDKVEALQTAYSVEDYRQALVALQKAATLLPAQLDTVVSMPVLDTVKKMATGIVGPTVERQKEVKQIVKQLDLKARLEELELLYMIDKFYRR